MKNFIAASVLACGLAAVTVSAVPVEVDPRRDPVVNAVEKVKDSVVNINTRQIVHVRDSFDTFFGQFYGPEHDVERKSLGSGVIVDEDGYILTNNHVIQRANEIQVAVGTNYYAAKLIATSPAIDVSLLKIEKKKPDEKFHAITFSRDDDVLLGETVIALGNPFGLGFSVSRGILSSTTRRPESDEGPLDYKDWLQTDAAINPGNSGGALVDVRGELIGLNVAVYREQNAQGISFAIPIKRVAEALSEILTSHESNQQLWFGAKISSSAGGLKVTSVEPGSPAQNASLRPGDFIAQIGSKVPRNFIQFIVEFLRLSDQQTNTTKEIPLVVSRGGERFNATVHLVAQKSVFNTDMIRKRIGATLQDITPDLQEYFGLPTNQGFLVAGVDPNSPAEKAGLQRGFLITELDGQPASNIVDIAKAFYNKKPGDSVQLNVTAFRRVSGNFLQMRQGTMDIKVR